MTIRIEWNYDALPQIRTSAPVVNMLAGLGQRILSRANGTLKSGKGYKMSPHIGPGRYNRAIVNIYPITAEAKTSNARLNTLAKIL